MAEFIPDYQNLVDAASNKTPKRIPLYEHIISDRKMEEILGTPFAHLLTGDPAELEEYFRQYCRFFREQGYDTVSYECCVGDILPFGGALGRHADPAITNREEFEKYPWDTVEELFFTTYGPRLEALKKQLPQGMRAVGGVGNGVFECVQELAGYVGLSYIRCDDEELYADLFQKVGDTLVSIWTRFLREYGDLYCVCRFGDDLGFKSAPLLPGEEVKSLIMPQYRRIVQLVHDAGKPFLLHSCGCIFELMDSLITEVGINAKHSNEDQIAPFPVWLEKYADQIGNFGGVDTDVLCSLPPEKIKEYVLDVLRACEGRGGVAIGSGNSIPDYVPAEGYLAMVNCRIS